MRAPTISFLSFVHDYDDQNQNQKELMKMIDFYPPSDDKEKGNGKEVASTLPGWLKKEGRKGGPEVLEVAGVVPANYLPWK